MNDNVKAFLVMLAAAGVGLTIWGLLAVAPNILYAAGVVIALFAVHYCIKLLIQTAREEGD